MNTAFFFLRAFRAEDLAAVQHLFHDTVWHVNCRDYTPAQLAAWAPETFDAARWLPSLLEHHTLVACANDAPEQILGFADMSADGYLRPALCSQGFSAPRHRHRAGLCVGMLGGRAGLHPL